MIYVKTVEMHGLRDRIQSCLKVGTDLVSLTTMSTEHIELTIRTINWLSEIYDVFDMNASQHEAYKFIFEEHLQEVTKKLVTDLADMIPKMAVIDDMSDTEKFRDYYLLLENYMEQLRVLDDYVEWINKEEKLFKVPQTKYPNLETLKDYVFPFAALMK